tara:strand:+ start:12634 stop:14622 length:1989 start_codon:yes stop_codon:yes gene_type:complete
MFERFTDRARKVMALANQEAQRLNHEYIGTEHILLGIVKEGAGVGCSALKALDVDFRKVRREVEKLVPAGPEVILEGKLPQTTLTKRVMQYAVEEARSLNHNYVGTEHLLLSLLREHDGVAAQVLVNLGLTLKNVREEVIELLGEADADAPGFGEPGRAAVDGRSRSKGKTPALDAFGSDLTELMMSPAAPEITDRREIIDRMIRVLARRLKSCPMLVGENGVGRRSQVYALARCIGAARIPALANVNRIVELDILTMVSGTKYRGQLEERMKALLNEVRRTGNTVVFLPDFPQLDEHPEVRTVLLQGLLTNQFRAVASVTPAWLREAKRRADPFVIRVFTEVGVAEAAGDDLKQILENVRIVIRDHHAIHVSSTALDAAAELGSLYRPHIRQPINAIELLDEAAVGLAATDFLLDGEDQKGNVSGRGKRPVRSTLSPACVSGDVDALKADRENSVGCLDVESVVGAVAMLTGYDAEMIRRRETDGVLRPQTVFETSLPPFERLQTESILQGDGVDIHPGLGFVLLPHTPEFEDIYKHAVQPAMEKSGIQPLKANDIFEPGSILNQVWNQIRHAEVIVADLSTSNLNVIFELGLCFGIRRSPILLVRDAKELPFNLRNLRHIEYTNDVGGISKLRTKLESSIASFLAEVRKPRDFDPLASGA